MKKQPSKEINLLKPAVVPWEAFEQEVYDFLNRSVHDGSLGLSPNTARVRPKPRYFSRDRGKDIVFDASIEVHPVADPTQLLLLWLFECKDYSHKVPVDDIEEFKAKKDQVHAHKGTIVTRIGFDTGAIEYATSNRIGLGTLRKEEYVTLKASASGGLFGEVVPAFTEYHDGEVGECDTLHHLLVKVLGDFGVLVLPVNLGERRLGSFEGFLAAERPERDS